MDFNRRDVKNKELEKSGETDISLAQDDIPRSTNLMAWKAQEKNLKY